MEAHGSSVCEQPGLDRASSATDPLIRKEAPSRCTQSTAWIFEALALDVGIVEGAPDVEPKNDSGEGGSPF